LGDYGVDLPFSTLETKHYTIGEGVNLPGARFAKSVETLEGRQLDEARIKSWTGSVTISIRPLHRNAFSFPPTHKLWLAFNHKPVIKDDSIAMWRRIRLVPFRHSFDDAAMDKNLLEKLRAEAPGILNWAIHGCLAWQRDGLISPKAAMILQVLSAHTKLSFHSLSIAEPVRTFPGVTFMYSRPRPARTFTIPSSVFPFGLWIVSRAEVSSQKTRPAFFAAELRGPAPEPHGGRCL